MDQRGAMAPNGGMAMASEERHDYVVVGAGTSGIALAYLLHKHGRMPSSWTPVRTRTTTPTSTI